MTKKPKGTIVVLGAGPSGLIAAYSAQKEGYKVIIIEKNGYVGGTVASIKRGNFIVDFGPHAYHPLSKRINKIIEENSNNNLFVFHAKQQLYIKGTIMSYPFKIGEGLKKLSPILISRIFLDYFYAKTKSLFFNTPQNSFKKWGEANFGKTMYDLCFGNYTEKVWGISADKISDEYAKIKLPNTSLLRMALEALTGIKNKISYMNIKKFAYHKRGIGQVFENISKQIKKNKGKVLLNSRIEQIVVSKENLVKEIALDRPHKKNIKCDYLISTIPLDDIINYLSRKSTKLTDAKDKLRFRHCLLINVILKRKKLLDANWIYLVDERFKFNRLSEQKTLCPLCAPKNKTLVTFETAYGENDRKDTWESKKLKQAVISELKFFGVKDSEIEEVFTNKLEKAYDVFLKNYDKHKNDILTEFNKIKNFISTGRHGLFMDIDMHDSMVLGLEGFKHLISQKSNEFYKNHEKINKN